MTHSAGLGLTRKIMFNCCVFSYAYRFFCQFMKAMPNKTKCMSEQTRKKPRKEKEFLRLP